MTRKTGTELPHSLAQVVDQKCSVLFLCFFLAVKRQTWTKDKQPGAWKHNTFEAHDVHPLENDLEMFSHPLRYYVISYVTKYFLQMVTTRVLHQLAAKTASFCDV